VQGDRSGLQSRRTMPRLKIFQPTQMQLGERSLRVHLLDISVGGALVHVAGPPDVGSRVTLDCAGVGRGAIVRWVGGSRFGVAFERPLSETEVERVIDAQAPRAPQPRPDQHVR
jgi:hypothetical protein